jgi:hypothetical protein
MFGWFRASAQCPVEPEVKDWMERRMLWLAQQFGWDRLRSVKVILPTPEFFPDPYHGSAEDATVILDRVCGYMGVDPQSIELALYEDRNPVHDEHGRQGTAGLYEGGQDHYRVWVEVGNLDDPLALVATMAHELGHVHLLGRGRLTHEDKDHERVTDLLTVFLGMGVFSANSVIRENYWTSGGWSGWNIGRQGYLTMPMFGYALSLFAWARQEDHPAWAKELRPDVRSPFDQGLRFLQQTNNSIFMAGR